MLYMCVQNNICSNFNLHIINNCFTYNDKKIIFHNNINFL